MPTTTPQTAESREQNLVHRERLSHRYHDDARHPWVAIALGTVVVVGLIVWAALGI